MKLKNPHKNKSTQHASKFRCNHFFRRRTRWFEHGVELIVCHECLKTFFHTINRTEYWAVEDFIINVNENESD